MEIEQMFADEEGWSDWIHPLPGYLMQCCDCGLIHDMEFAIVPRSDVAGDGSFNEGENEQHMIIFRAKRHDKD
jgi:hypothetical protein